MKALLLLTCVSSSLSLAVEVVEISAPIFPKTSVLYAQEGANFPADIGSKQQLALDAALVYENLLQECAPRNPAITLQSASGTALTSQQLYDNYNAVAECAYQTYTAKPYWIPKLIDDVDVCGLTLGGGWALLSEADLNSFAQADFVFFENTLTQVAAGTSFWGSFYFSLSVFVRAVDGSIQEGSLSSTASPRIQPIVYPDGWDATKHLERGLSLRCIRRTTIP